MTYITGATATHFDIPIAIPRPRIDNWGRSAGAVVEIPTAKAGDTLPITAIIDTIAAKALPTNLEV